MVFFFQFTSSQMNTDFLINSRSVRGCTLQGVGVAETAELGRHFQDSSFQSFPETNCL